MRPNSAAGPARPALIDPLRPVAQAVQRAAQGLAGSSQAFAASGLANWKHPAGRTTRIAQRAAQQAVAAAKSYASGGGQAAVQAAAVAASRAAQAAARAGVAASTASPLVAPLAAQAATQARAFQANAAAAAAALSKATQARGPAMQAARAAAQSAFRAQSAAAAFSQGGGAAASLVARLAARKASSWAGSAAQAARSAPSAAGIAAAGRAMGSASAAVQAARSARPPVPGSIAASVAGLAPLVARFAGPVGLAVTGTIALREQMARLARQVGETSKRIHFYGETVSAGNRHLGSFSAEIGRANLALGLGDLSRTYRLARATEGSAASLARSINQARNSWQGYNEVRANARNLLGGGAAGLDSVAGAASSVMAKVGEAMAESLIRKLNPALAKDPDAPAKIGQATGVGGVAALYGFLFGAPAGAKVGAGLADAVGQQPQPVPGFWNEALGKVAARPVMRKPRPIPRIP